ncbi:MAG: type II secretion system protein GspM [Gammaproteobacteria bacterium]
MREWYEQLAPRERILVLVAGTLILVALVVSLGIRPIMQQSARGQALVEDKRELLGELRDVAARLGPQSGDTPTSVAGGTQSLVLIVDQTTRSGGLAPYLKRNQPDGADSIRLRLENAPFDSVIAWLNGLRIQHGVSVTTANIDMASATGRVNCNLTLVRTGS